VLLNTSNVPFRHSTIIHARLHRCIHDPQLSPTPLAVSPERRVMASGKPPRVHLQGLVRSVENNGGWEQFGSYLLESAILADKILSFWEMARPVRYSAGVGSGGVTTVGMERG
jgi:hypothetical protein